MSKAPLSLRPASAAIAAVLALTTTAAVAQDGAPADALAAPVIAPVIAPVDPVAPGARPAEPTQPTAPPTTALPEPLRTPPLVAPSNPATTTKPPPEVPSIERPLPSVEPVPQTDRPDRPRAVATIIRPAAPRRAPAIPVANARSSERAEVLASPSAAAVSTPQTPESPLVPVIPPVLPAVPVEAPAVSVAAVPSNDGGIAEWALFGGLVGIGGIAAAAALSRRRRPQPDPEPQASSLPHEIFPSVDSNSARYSPTLEGPVAPVVGASVATLARSATASHRNSSRQAGRHEAMVDAGPTAENPFLTRRKRLARARFLDRQDAASEARLSADNEARPRYAAR